MLSRKNGIKRANILKAKNNFTSYIYMLFLSVDERHIENLKTAHDNCSLRFFFFLSKNEPYGPNSTYRGSKSKFQIFVHFWCVAAALRFDNCNFERLSLYDMFSK